jgi:hypothetical protein
MFSQDSMENTIFANIYDFIIKNTIKNDESIKFKQIYNSIIPKSVKTYFFIQTEKFLSEEKFISLKGERFDFTSMEVRKQILRLENLIKEHCVFQRDEFEEYLKEAINLQLNYLKSPAKTLIDFIYYDSDIKNFNQIVQSFKYFTDYVYYGEIIESYFEQKEIENITREECKNILRKIDNAIIKRLTQEEIAWMAKPLSDFLNIEKQERKANTDFLISFYEDKELYGLASALKLEKDIRGKSYFTFDEIHTIIQQVDDLKKPFGINREENTSETDIEKPEKAVIEANNQIISEKPVETVVKPVDAKKPDDTEELRKTRRKIIDLSEDEEFKDAKKANIIKEAIENFDIEVRTDIFVPKNKNQINETKNNKEEKKELKQAEEQKSIIKPSELLKPDLDNMKSAENNKMEADQEDNFIDISEKERRMFIKKIFNKNEAEYEKTIKDLKKCKNWNEAAFYIDKLFINNEINPYSTYAVDFTNKLQDVF